MGRGVTRVVCGTQAFRTLVLSGNASVFDLVKAVACAFGIDDQSKPFEAKNTVGNLNLCDRVLHVQDVMWREADPKTDTADWHGQRARHGLCPPPSSLARRGGVLTRCRGRVPCCLVTPPAPHDNQPAPRKPRKPRTNMRVRALARACPQGTLQTACHALPNHQPPPCKLAVPQGKSLVCTKTRTARASKPPRTRGSA